MERAAPSCHALSPWLGRAARLSRARVAQPFSRTSRSALSAHVAGDVGVVGCSCGERRTRRLASGLHAASQLPFRMSTRRQGNAQSPVTLSPVACSPSHRTMSRPHIRSLLLACGLT